MHTTFNQLKEWRACEDGYRKLAKHLGGIAKYGKETPINLSTILESNGLEDCFWVIDYMELTPEQYRDFRLLACDYAESVLPIFEREYPEDRRPRNCIEVARRYAVGESSQDELAAASRAAARAAWDAWDAWGAWDASRAAARSAARAAARAVGSAEATGTTGAAGAAWASGWANVIARDTRADRAARAIQSDKLMALLRSYE